MEIVNPHSIEHRTHFELRFPAFGWTTRTQLRNGQTAVWWTPPAVTK